MFNDPIPDVPGTPPEMMALLRAGMANDEASRPTAIELRDALQALQLGPVAPAPVLIPPLGSPPMEPVFLRPSYDEETVPHASPPGNELPAYRPPEPGPVAVGAPLPPVTPSSHRALWWSAAAGAVMMLALAAIFVAYGPGRPHPDPSRTPEAFGTSSAADSSRSPARSSAPPSGRPAPGPVNATPCGTNLPTLANARCPTTAECYDAAKNAAGCGGRHTWEVFAYADLPASANVSDPQSGARNPAIRDVCALTTLAVLQQGDPFLWSIDVLPPTAEALRAGNRTYRCLAGKGPNALNGQALSRPRKTS
jgi:hypothetical protein